MIFLHKKTGHFFQVKGNQFFPTAEGITQIRYRDSTVCYPLINDVIIIVDDENNSLFKLRQRLGNLYDL